MNANLEARNGNTQFRIFTLFLFYLLQFRPSESQKHMIKNLKDDGEEYETCAYF